MYEVNTVLCFDIGSNNIYVLYFLCLSIIPAHPTPPSPRIIDSKLLIPTAEKTSRISLQTNCRLMHLNAFLFELQMTLTAFHLSSTATTYEPVHRVGLTGSQNKPNLSNKTSVYLATVGRDGSYLLTQCPARSVEGVVAFPLCATGQFVCLRYPDDAASR